jgi:hypothetical protein
MHNLEEEPRNGSEMLWLMAVLVIALSTKVDRRRFAPSFAALAAAHLAYGQPTGLSA